MATLNQIYNRCDKTGDCWLWTRAVNNEGHPVIWHGDKTRLTTRVVWELTHNRQIPDDMFIKHHCGNKLCIKPEHLVPCGYKGKLTKAQIQKIQASWPELTQNAIAELFGITRARVNQILKKVRSS